MIMTAKLTRPPVFQLPRGRKQPGDAPRDSPAGGSRPSAAPARAAMRVVAPRQVPSLLALGFLLLQPIPAAAQQFDAVGTRAQGMAGAFVAVADDASATWWNPAGLGTGAYLSAVLERGQNREPADPPASGPAMRNSTSGFALAYPALGLSYYRLRVSEIGPADSIGAEEPGRQDQGTGDPVLRSVSMSAFGATVGQSLGNHVVVASTIRLVRAGAVQLSDVTGPDPLNRAEDASVARQTKGDLDLGVMMRFGVIKVGGALKHVGEPAFDDGTGRVVLKRQARAGVALTKGRIGVFDSLIAAMDVDLTENADGPGRRPAARRRRRGRSVRQPRGASRRAQRRYFR